MLTSADDKFPFVKGFTNFLTRYKYHLIAWSIIIFYEVALIGFYTSHFSSFTTYALVYVVNISLFYVHAHVVLKFSLSKSFHAIWILPILVFIEMVVYLFVLRTAQDQLIKHTHLIEVKDVTLTLQYILGTLFRGLYFVVFSTGYYFLFTYLIERRKTDRLEHERLENLIRIGESENAYLRAQINPHFLFNTLDFMYHSARKTAPVLADAIHSLSGMMRYSIESTNNKNLVYFEQEIAQLENLIALHQIRADYGLHLDLSYEDEINEYGIIPLLLTTLAENMFKHGDLSHPAKAGKFEIELSGDDLHISTQNLIGPIKSVQNLGSGMQNIRKRLNYTYQNEVQFSAQAADEWFIVEIKIRNFKHHGIPKDN